MIELTRINGTKILVNPDLIEVIEHHTDSVISLTTGNKIIVKESLEEIKQKVIEFKSEIMKRINL
jgi:flagellar protein FlbD